MVSQTLSDTLKAALARHLAHGDDGQDVAIGEFRLGDSPSFGCDVADTFAELSGQTRRDDFRRMLSARDFPKPAKPSADYMEAEARAVESDPTKRPYVLALLESRLRDKYHSALSDYEKTRQERDTLEQSYENTDLGYIRFLCTKDPGAVSFFFDRYRTLPISEEDRKRHTYITGGAGSGKSEALKAIIFHYLARNTSTAVVLIDPHGDVAEEVAHWPELADGKRLVFIDPALSPDRVPVFNPLDIPDDERYPKDISIIVKQLVEVFPELVSGLEFTPQMRTMLAACLTVLLYKPGSSIADLLDFLDDDTNGPWLDFADRVLAGSLFRRFFARDFRDKNMDVTKRGIRLRLLEVLGNNPLFASLIEGRSSFNLEEALNRRAVVIFRFGRGDTEEGTTSIVGKFIIARLKAFAFKQGRLPLEERVPVHVFIDECQNFLSKSIGVILKEARKYGVHLTLAQQILGDDMSPELLKAVLSNTAVKITGRNATHTLKKIAEETGADMTELQALNVGYFHIKTSRPKGVVVRMPSHRINDKGAIPPKAWERLCADQLARFYRLPSPSRVAGEVVTRQRLPID
jgi:hypothetical protein